MFVLHLLAFAAFVTLSIQIDTTPGNKSASPEKVAVYLAIWPGLATIFVLLWLRSWAHLTWWWQWLKNARRSLLAAAWISLLIVAVSALSQDLCHWV